jgi:predicted transcriptional regulator
MDRWKLTQAELGELLGISQQMVSRLKSLGMPTDSAEAARAWRARHLDSRLTVDYRLQRQRRRRRHA